MDREIYYEEFLETQGAIPAIDQLKQWQSENRNTVILREHYAITAKAGHMAPVSGILIAYRYTVE